MTGIVRDVDAFAGWRAATGDWRVTRRQRNGTPMAWATVGAVVRTGTNGAGLLCFNIKFRDGRTCTQSTLAEAQEYAEAQLDRREMCVACGERSAVGPGSRHPDHCEACGRQQ